MSSWFSIPRRSATTPIDDDKAYVWHHKGPRIELRPGGLATRIEIGDK